ncbi:aminotransferase class I/II-fold pyridoxal phosphate-dependent enzyme [Aquibacillus sp. 3ASR75-11]|uniref:homocysteine desulfhydrase n=1 Tax=Terrihalobacillus insolitus TaxID=2950438 RepID=A0A9X3WX11_9BACI|nr:aminotransferase class I/II-fold pyridoxal phosphate-dependent enzyme [Terrihalobacillus insolitus]MDC3415096.1 aminotransferase class I/II-fold pyridoxal phosphate-dependent enzyme [Terrihalobacillus insolitus]MDC3426093.1 aminotransferase class I/II-fold pyridoxal phosphate-dependent enzyme [Terrihalobacillus insolitus]
MEQNFDTKTVHLSQNKSKTISSKVTPIYQTSSFKFTDLEDLENFYQGKNDYLYTRVGNPNTDELGSAVSQLEGAPDGIATSSGLSAILAGILSVAKQGDHILASADIYGGTYHLLAYELKDFGIDVEFVDFSKIDLIEQKIRSNTTLLYSESITNPLLRVENLNKIVKTGEKYQLFTMIDNTFATPYLCRPFQSGIDLIVHSATKYIGGHSDVTAGVLVGREDLIQKARTKVINLGSNLSPFEAWLACRGLKTLSVRMERQSKNAQLLADALTNHPAVKKVYYPKSFSSKGKGAIVSIDITGLCDINVFFKSLKWIKIVPTLAGVETTVSYPLSTSHRALPPETQEKLNITEGLVRISVGIEDADDIIVSLKDALEKAYRG